MRIIRKSLFLILIVCTLLFLGFYRDFLFKNINGLLKAWDFNVYYSLPSSLDFLEKYTYDELINIKWILTLFFFLLYLLVTLFTIYILFYKKQYIRITLTLYVGILLISGVCTGIGSIFQNTTDKMYEFTRYLMGMAQSPIILMILVPAFKLSGKEKKS